MIRLLGGLANIPAGLAELRNEGHVTGQGRAKRITGGQGAARRPRRAQRDRLRHVRPRYRQRSLARLGAHEITRCETFGFDVGLFRVTDSSDWLAATARLARASAPTTAYRTNPSDTGRSRSS